MTNTEPYSEPPPFKQWYAKCNQWGKGVVEIGGAGKPRRIIAYVTDKGGFPTIDDICKHHHIAFDQHVPVLFCPDGAFDIRNYGHQDGDAAERIEDWIMSQFDDVHPQPPNEYRFG